MTLVWSDDLHATGVARIDEQHKALFGCVNGLRDAIAGPDPTDGVLEAMEFLEHYVASHFVCEEGHMEQRCSPQACAMNRAAHSRFIDAYAKIAARIRGAGVSLPVARELEAMISDWLVSHIVNVDAKVLRGR